MSAPIEGCIENGISSNDWSNRLKQFRRVATRYEKRADNYQAMLILAAIVLWL